MIEASVDCVITIDAQSMILEFNAAAEQTFGYRRDDVIGKPLTEAIIPSSLREGHRRGMAALLQGRASKVLGRRVEMPGMRSDGSEFPVELTVIQIPGQTPPIFTAYLRDITERKRDEHKLRESEARFRLMFEKSGVGMALATIDGIFLQANAAFCALLGRPEEEVVGHNTAEFTHPDDLEKTLKPDPKVREDGAHIVDLEKRYFRKDGATVWAHVTSVLHLNEDAQPLYRIAIVEDISERKKAEEKLWHSLNLLRAITEGTSDAIFAKDRAGRYLMANTATANLLGKRREEIVGLDDTHLFTAETAARIVTRDRGIMESGATRSDEDTTTTQNGVSRVFLTTKGPLLDHAGIVMGVFGVSRDITERKREEAVLRESEARTRLLIKSSNVGLWDWNLVTDDVFFSPEWKSQLGYADDEVPGRYEEWESRLHPEDREQALRAVQDFREGRREDYDIEFRLRHKDGSWRSILTRADLIRDASGQPVRMLGCHIDITARRQGEQARRESEERFRQIAENINEVFWVWTAVPGNACLLYVSPAYATIWGRSCESLYLSPQSWKEALHPDDKEWVLAEIADLDVEEMSDLTYRILRPDQSVRWIRDRIFPVRDGRGVVVRFAGIAEDITESKTIENALKRAEEQYRSIFNNAVDGIFRTSPDGEFLVANPAAAQIFGFASPEELIEERRDIAREGYVDPRRREEFKRMLQEQGAVNDFEYEAYRKDGSRVWICENTRAVHAPSGEILYFEGIFEDITERKHAEAAQERGISLVLATLESTADGILVVNTEGKIETFNRLFARMWRLPDEVLASKEDARALQCVLDQLIEPEKFLEKVNYLYQHPEEESFDRLSFKDGRVFERYSRPQFIGGKVAGRVWSFRDATERRRAAKALEEANERLRFLSRRLFHIQEEERRHLARELHDEIGQTLTAAKINLKIIASDVPPKVTGRLDDSIQLLDRLLRQVRQLSLDLRPPLLDELGLVPTLRWLVDQQAQRAGLRIAFTTNVNGLELDPEVQTACFRVAQEAITNIIRHSGAKNVAVELRREAERLWLKVRDDGAGFDPAAIQQTLTQHSTLGLVSMKERASLVRGGLEVTSTAGQGTEIRAWFPLAFGEHPFTERA
jgi:PAS domain S-box-containing protein